MAQRTDTELRVFLEGTLAQYNALTDKTGTVFFDKGNHAVYAKGECIIQSNIKDVTYNESSTELTITPFNGTPVVINLGIQSELEGLETTLKTWVGTNYVKQVADSRLMTDTEGTKLAGIDEGAQTNREVTVNGNPIGRDNEENQSTIKISGNLVTAPNNGEDSKIEFYLSHKYYPTENKIRFFKTATPPDVYNEATHEKYVVLTIDTSDFVKDSFVEKVEFNKVTSVLSITFVYADGSKNTIPIDLSTLMNLYTAGKGLTETINDDGLTTFGVALGKGLAFDTSNAITLSLGNGLSFDNSGKLVVDFESNGVTSINGMGGGAYLINHKGVTVGTGNALHPIWVNNDSSAKKLTIEANPAEMLALFFHENKKNENATSGIRAKGVLIEEAADGNPYSMLMDFTPKVWQF